MIVDHKKNQKKVHVSDGSWVEINQFSGTISAVSVSVCGSVGRKIASSGDMVLLLVLLVVLLVLVLLLLGILAPFSCSQPTGFVQSKSRIQ